MLRWQWGLLWLAAALGGVFLPARPAADRQFTVCTVTVNSADEQAALARSLPASRFRFVELVKAGRPDWLSVACRSGTACDAMVISGHFDGGNEFFSDGSDDPDEAEKPMSLRVSELERAACGGGCSGLFSRLKEVYLFGCNTLSAQALSETAADTVRSAVRERESRSAPGRSVDLPGTVYGESSRERMRQIFRSVPVIYGFPSMAPLGPLAAASLERYLRGGGRTAFGRGRPDPRLLDQFAAAGLTVTQGVSDGEASARWDVCRFADERLPDAQVVRHMHRLLRRDMSEVRTHLDRLQRITDAVTARVPRSPALAGALRDLADDFISRLRFLEAARAADEPLDRMRMLRLARDLGWLTPVEHHSELRDMLGETYARQEPGIGDVAAACALNTGGEFNGAWRSDQIPGKATEGGDRLSRAALRACLGDEESRARMLAKLVGADDADLQLAHVYLRHRPIVGSSELARVLKGVVAEPSAAVQARALLALGRQAIDDLNIVDTLARLYASTPSEPVQVAVAGLLVRADRSLLERAHLLPMLVERRVGPAAGGTKVDALMARLRR